MRGGICFVQVVFKKCSLYNQHIAFRVIGSEITNVVQLLLLQVALEACYFVCVLVYIFPCSPLLFGPHLELHTESNLLKVM